MHDITDRGFIAAGKIADITIFDPDTIAPRAREPVVSLPGGGVEVKREAEGIDHVIVNAPFSRNRREALRRSMSFNELFRQPAPMSAVPAVGGGNLSVTV